MHGCYLLKSATARSTRTYIGYTVDPRRRLRQHNGEIKHGAKSSNSGRPWEMVLFLYNFPDKKTAMQFEWAWKHPRKSLTIQKAVEGFSSSQIRGVNGKILVMFEMLKCHPWSALPLELCFFSTTSPNLKAKYELPQNTGDIKYCTLNTFDRTNQSYLKPEQCVD